MLQSDSRALRIARYVCPVGDIHIVTDDRVLLRVSFGPRASVLEAVRRILRAAGSSTVDITRTQESNTITETLFSRPQELNTITETVFSLFDRYFSAARVRMEVPLVPARTSFEEAVRQALMAIPCGEVRTYGWVAARVGSPAAARAVGQVCALNPYPIIVPCHRVVLASGGIGRYSAGTLDDGRKIKRALLELEGFTAPA